VLNYTIPFFDPSAGVAEMINWIRKEKICQPRTFSDRACTFSTINEQHFTPQCTFPFNQFFRSYMPSPLFVKHSLLQSW